jgi:hypothetical protein
MQRIFFASWIPTHHNLGNSLLARIRELLVRDFSLSGIEKLYILSGLPNTRQHVNGVLQAPSTMAVAILDTGVFLAERVSDEPIDANSFRKDALVVYERLKKSVHFHIFSRELSPEFPVVTTFPSNASLEEVENKLCEQLRLKYLDEMVEQQGWTDSKKTDYVVNLRDHCRDVLKAETLYPNLFVRRIHYLMTERTRLGSFLSSTITTAGMQTFLDSLCSLTSKTAEKHSTSFLEAESIARENLKEYKETIGGYTVQLLILCLTALLVLLTLAGTLMAIFLSDVALWEQVLTIVGFYVVLYAGIYYLFVRDVAKMYLQITEELAPYPDRGYT